MPNYQNAMIYKLVCNDLNISDIYIGSTVSFRRRKYQHKQCCNNINNKRHNLKVYKFIRDNSGWDNWSMVLVANTPCNSKLELAKHERKYYEELNATLNSDYPGRTQKEWVENNKEHVKIKAKEYNKANKEIIKIKQKEWREANKEIIKIKYKEYYKEWRENNKEHIKIKRTLKINCPICDKLVIKSGIKRHQRSKKCIEIGKLI